MLWFLYNIVFAVGFVLALPYYLFRMWRRGGYRKHFVQRLAWYSRALRERLGARRRIWIHAVSVGEFFVAERFMAELRRRRPGSAFVVSTATSTAHALAEKRLCAEDALIYFPFDFPLIMRKVLAVVRPEALILVEGELWPNLVHVAHGRGVPVVVINGRVSARSYRRMRRLRFLVRRGFQGVAWFCMQSRTDADRLRDCGVDPARLVVTGSAKYDGADVDPASGSKADAILGAAGIVAGDPILVGGSTWLGEEAALLDICRRLRREFPNLRLVLVPRHAERRQAVRAEIEQRGLRLVQRSLMKAGDPPPAEAPDVLLVDTTGELKHFYARATAIFVGKSLTQHGGQNLIEPAAYGRAIMVGPNMENFADVTRDFLDAEALLQVPDAAGLEAALGRLLRDAALRRGLGERAAGVVARQRGATRQTVDLLMERVPSLQRPA